MEHDDVHDRASFVHYVVRLIADLDDPILAKRYEHTDVRSLLEAVESWATDADEAVSANPWRNAAEVLRAGMSYE